MFEKECALALRLGMTYEQYWCGDVDAMIPFALYYYQKSREEFIFRDTAAWLNGQYVMIAFSKVMSEAFSKKGSPSKIKYPEEPLYMNTFDENAEARRRERELKKAHANFLAAVHNMGMTIQETAS